MEGNAKLFTHCQLKEVFIKLKQVSGINRKLKKKNIYPQMTHMDTDGGPQADGGGERELFTHCLLIEEFIKLRKFFASSSSCASS